MLMERNMVKKFTTHRLINLLEKDISQLESKTGKEENSLDKRHVEAMCLRDFQKNTAPGADFSTT